MIILLSIIAIEMFLVICLLNRIVKKIAPTHGKVEQEREHEYKNWLRDNPLVDIEDSA